MRTGLLIFTFISMIPSRASGPVPVISPTSRPVHSLLVVLQLEPVRSSENPDESGPTEPIWTTSASRTLPSTSSAYPEDADLLRMAVPDTARHIGGLTIFGRDFGNYNQDIEFRITYSCKKECACASSERITNDLPFRMPFVS